MDEPYFNLDKPVCMTDEDKATRRWNMNSYSELKQTIQQLVSIPLMIVEVYKWIA
jgi:hypothetical protein